MHDNAKTEYGVPPLLANMLRKMIISESTPPLVLLSDIAAQRLPILTKELETARDELEKQRLAHTQYLNVVDLERLFNQVFTSQDTVNELLKDTSLPAGQQSAARTALEVLILGEELKVLQTDTASRKKVDQQRQYQIDHGHALSTSFSPEMTLNERTAGEVGLKWDEYYAAAPDYTLCFENWCISAAPLRTNLKLVYTKTVVDVEPGDCVHFFDGECVWSSATIPKKAFNEHGLNWDEHGIWMTVDRRNPYRTGPRSWDPFMTSRHEKISWRDLTFGPSCHAPAIPMKQLHLFDEYGINNDENRFVGTSVFGNIDETITPEVYLQQCETICASLASFAKDKLVEKPNEHWVMVHARAVVDEWRKFESSL
jgi:hypothetical protein